MIERPTVIVAERRRWPAGMRALVAVSGVSVTVGAGQILYWMNSPRPLFDSPRVQITYWAAVWLLSVAALAAALLRRRRAFGLLCLAGCATNVVVTSVFNLGILQVIGPAELLVRLRRWDWDANAWYYGWNWLAIAGNTAAAFYLLRYETPFWRRGSRPTAPAFGVAIRGPDAGG